jgi:hypothetical protein
LAANAFAAGCTALAFALLFAAQPEGSFMQYFIVSSGHPILAHPLLKNRVRVGFQDRPCSAG